MDISSLERYRGCLLGLAAVYDQLAGAYYGEGSIPLAWRSKLAWRDLIEHFADELFSLAGNR